MMTTEAFIVSRLQRLAAMGLDRQPGAELLSGTARVWAHHLGRFSLDRLTIAFDAIERSATSWPAVGSIINALPAYPVAMYGPPVPRARRIAPDPQQVARSENRAKTEIEKIAALLRINNNEGTEQ